jgi:hypothetical protein
MGLGLRARGIRWLALRLPSRGPNHTTIPRRLLRRDRVCGPLPDRANVGCARLTRSEVLQEHCISCAHVLCGACRSFPRLISPPVLMRSSLPLAAALESVSDRECFPFRRLPLWPEPVRTGCTAIRHSGFLNCCSLVYALAISADGLRPAVQPDEPRGGRKGEHTRIG